MIGFDNCKQEFPAETLHSEALHNGRLPFPPSATSCALPGVIIPGFHPVGDCSAFKHGNTKSCLSTHLQKSLGTLLLLLRTSVWSYTFIFMDEETSLENWSNLPEVAQLVQNIAELSDNLRFWTVLNLLLCHRRSSDIGSAEWNSAPGNNGCNLAKDTVRMC